MGPEQLVSLAYAMFALFWLVLGTAIGSFLNVVVYRLPRGMNLAHPPSRCPACRHGIRWRDNVPVFGWLLLGGRCRDCAYPIAPRYPFVEAMIGLVFLILAVVELLSGGVNLPFRPTEPGLRGMSFPGVELHLLTLLHAMLFTCLVAMALIDQDGQPLPSGLWLLPLLLLPLADSLHPCGGYIGLVVGAVCGVGIGMLYAPGDGRRRWAATLGLMLVGGYLGWPAPVSALLASGVCWLVLFVAAPEYRRRYPLSPLVPTTLAAFVYLLNWRLLVT